MAPSSPSLWKCVFLILTNWASPLALHLGLWTALNSELSGSSAGLPGPALGPGGEGGCFRGAGTQTQGVVLPIVLVQRPQDRLLGADGLQSRGQGHRAVEFLQLVLIAPCLLPEGLQAAGHVVLAGGPLAAQVRDEACGRRGNHSLQLGRRSCPNASESQPVTWHFFLGPGRCIFPKAINTSKAVVSMVAGPSQGHKKTHKMALELGREGLSPPRQ